MNNRDLISQRVCKLLLAGDSDVLMKMLESGEVHPDDWIDSTVEGEKFHLLPAVIERNWSDLAVYLISRGADINERSTGSTPLMIACGVRNREIIDALIAAGADVNAKNSCGETALMISAGRGDLPAVKALLQAGADVKKLTSRKQSANHFALTPSRSDASELVRELVTAGCPLLGSELHFPVHRRDVDMVRLLLQLGCPPNERFRTAEKRGPQNGETPLTAAITTNEIDSLARGFNRPSTIGKRVEIAKLLLNHGADPNLPNAKGWTPLMLAVWENEMQLADALLSLGAAPDYAPPDSQVGSPREIAAKRKVTGFSELVQQTRKQLGG